MKAKDLLEAIRGCPEMFGIFDRENRFSGLVAFISGFHSGFGFAKETNLSSTPDLIPRDFHVFVLEKLGPKNTVEGGWEALIREHTSSQLEAFDLFFQLCGEYERANQTTK